MLALFIGLFALLQSKVPPAITEMVALHRGEDRVLIILSDASAKTVLSVATQIFVAKEEWDGFTERDLVVYEWTQGLDLKQMRVTDGEHSWRVVPPPYSPYPDELLKYTGFATLLVGNDGTVKKYWVAPVSAEGLFEIIDAMPMRQQEMRERADQNL